MTDLIRYRRQITLFGAENQRKLADAHVAVIGAGGLGSPALLYLAGAGVGTVTIIDDDVVDTSNLHRQVIHTTAGVGRPKAESAAEAMRELNPEVSLRLFAQRLTWANAREAFEGADLIMDGADNFDTRHIASTSAARLGIPHVWGSILGHEAQTSVFWAGHGPVYEDVFAAPPPPGAVPSCSQAGVLGPLVGVIGSTMALEALKLLTGLGTPLLGRLGYYDGMAGTWEYVPLTANPAVTRRLLSEEPARQEPAVTVSVAEVDEIPENAVLIDVRELEEVAHFAIPGSVHVPLGEILAGTVPAEIDTERPVVVYCAGGVRSARAVEALTKQGHAGLLSLRGGIDAWLEAQA
ncbi:ThiF family adenylyltransferase [Corynebacterium guangdongense]|uniref:Adenylyltransferase/sulfurtransferase n=1 Tax=Corynebacterium guangdongense TaxID=1783348 RepID=A0ABU2A0N9_9CORY|nr:ThiF family adenylyltransferase [Corynebacterium guangdongense]MDR7330751.1 adenylyltransferase/sulfurtransferase [Corynebacterium guangdongense]WJZ16766.1 putative adenylyltransferase/sulfurtransferase MoeZ [Corynebacterium guangdongense]